MDSERLSAAEHVSQNIRNRRVDAQMTLEALAAAVQAEADHHLGVNALSRIERGERRVDVEDLMAISAVFDIPVDFLFYHPDVIFEDRLLALLDAWREAVHQWKETERAQGQERRFLLSQFEAALCDRPELTGLMRQAIQDSKDGPTWAADLEDIITEAEGED